MSERPTIVCICGSTRFADAMNEVAERETLEGRIVVRPEVAAYSSGKDPQFVAPEVKARLDELHLRKIDLADEIVVVAIDGYVGESTQREIDYAYSLRKPIKWRLEEAREWMEAKPMMQSRFPKRVGEDTAELEAKP